MIFDHIHKDAWKLVFTRLAPILVIGILAHDLVLEHKNGMDELMDHLHTAAIIVFSASLSLFITHRVTRL